MNLGIIGKGFVGNAIVQGLNHYYNLRVYDIDPKRSTNTFEEAIGCDLTFLCVPTPMHKDTGECDLSYIESVFEKVNQAASTSCIFVIKSTVPVGTTKKLNEKYKNIKIIHSPEFLTARTAATDFICPSRHIVGGETENGTDRLKQIYEERFPGVPCYAMTSDESEFIKYFANCFFATKVSYFNEMAIFARAHGLDWNRIIEGVMSDGRIGISHYQVPGHDGNFGFGGTCFPKDINALIKSFEKSGTNPIMLKAAWERNLLARNEKDWETSKSAVS